MTAVRILPLTMALLSVAAAGVYAIDGDWKRCIYWLAAATLTAVVTAL